MGTLDDGTIQAYDQNSGAKVWTQKGLRDQLPGQVTAYGNWLLAAAREGYLHVMSQVDGELVGRVLLRPKPLHISYPNQTEGTNWHNKKQENTQVKTKGLLQVERK